MIIGHYLASFAPGSSSLLDASYPCILFLFFLLLPPSSPPPSLPPFSSYTSNTFSQFKKIKQSKSTYNHMLPGFSWTIESWTRDLKLYPMHVSTVFNKISVDAWGLLIVLLFLLSLYFQGSSLHLAILCCIFQRLHKPRLLFYFFLFFFFTIACPHRTFMLCQISLDDVHHQ